MTDHSNYWKRRRLSRRGFIAGAGTAVVGAGALLAGCGDDDDDSDAAPTSGTGTTPQSGQTAAPTALAGKKGGTLKLVKAVPDVGVDPAITVTYPLHTSKVYGHTHVYRASDQQVHFDLALSYEQVDPKTLTFKLRPGVNFQAEVANGRALTSEDLKYSWSRYPNALAKLGSQFNKINWGWMDAASGATFETPDPQTITIKQNAPFADNIAALGNYGFAIVAKEMVEGSADQTLRQVINAGSGAYKMVRRESTGTRFERNPNYHKKDKNSDTFLIDGPYIDAIEEVIIADPGAAKNRFLAGEIDVLNTSLVPIDKLVAEEMKKANGVKLVESDTNKHLILAFDNVKWTIKELREAISLSIDRDALIRQVFVGDGIYGAPVANGFPGLTWSQDKLKTYQKFDPQKAKQLWTQFGGDAKFGGKLRFVANNSNPVNVQVSQFVAAEVKKNIGIETTLEAVDANTYTAKAVAPVKEWELFIASNFAIATIASYNALTHYVPSGFGGVFPNLKLDSPEAETAARAKQVQALYDAQAQETNKQERIKKMDALQEFLLTQFSTVLPMPIQKTEYGAYRTRVKGFPEKDWVWGHSSASEFRVQTMWLDS